MFERESFFFLNNLVYLVNRYTVKQDKEDQSKWNVSPNGDYNMEASYTHLLKDQEENNEEEKATFKAIWNKWMPSKVCINVWRVLWE